MADTKTSALTAATTVDPADLVMTVDVSDTSMAASGTNKKATREQLQTYAAGTLTTDKKVADFSATWNNGAVAFTGVKLAVTDTASDAASALADMHVGGSSKFKVGKDGAVTAAAGVSGTTLTSTVATGTAPLTVASTTAVTNLNADLLDGNHAAAFVTAASLGTGVATALAVNTGSAGAVVVNGGALGTPSSGTLTSCSGLPVSTGVSGLGTGVATALAVNTGSSGAVVVNGGALGTPSSGTVTNLTGTASININGTVGATTPTTGAFTTLSATGNVSFDGGTFVFNDSGADKDFRVEGDTDANLLFCDASADKVGIGTSTPGARLAVVDETDDYGADTTRLVLRGGTGPDGSAYSGIRFQVREHTTGWGCDIQAMGQTGSYGGALRFRTGGTSATTKPTERMRIDSSGNVSIGASSTSLSGATSGLFVQRAGLEVLGINNGNNSHQSWVFAINDSGLGNAGRLSLCQIVNGSNAGIAGGPAVPIISAEIPTTANATPRIYVNAGGEVLAGGTTDNGAYNLQCNGTAVWGAGAYVNGSDARIKENVAPIQSGLSVVEKLNPVTFNYLESWSKDRSTQPGFIAQELQTALADEVYVEGVVQQGPEYMSVAYQSLIPILTKAIQEQQQQIDALKAEVAALKGNA